MGDNKPIEEQAESYIKSQLLKFNFHVMKPSFDKEGSDLVIIESVTKQNSRLIKVQSKGRTVSATTTSVTIPRSYVKDDFIVFIYTVDERKNESCFLFFSEEISEWKINGTNYTISFNESKLNEEYFNNKRFNHQLAKKIQLLLAKTEIKKYTSVIIDGIFLEKAIINATMIYEKVWPEKTFAKPDLNSIIENILNSYNRYQSQETAINCYLILSNSFNLETVLNIDHDNLAFSTKSGSPVRLFINKTDEIIAFEVLDQIERLVNNDNLILVADDIVYESELNRFKESGIEMTLVRSNDKTENKMTVHFKWGDITYPIGFALGLERHEI